MGNEQTWPTEEEMVGAVTREGGIKDEPRASLRVVRLARLARDAGRWMERVGTGSVIPTEVG